MASSVLIPKGDPVTKPVPALSPSPTKVLTHTLATIHKSAKSISLVPLNLSHAPDLLINIGGTNNDHLHTYMPSGPFPTLESLESHINLLHSLPGWFSYAIISSSPTHLSNTSTPTTTESTSSGTAIGIICLLNMQPTHLSVEIGHVLFPSTLQRTSESTAINYLLMNYVFEELGYERVEWKCNTMNAPSRRAAERLGFRGEGVFRRHMVVRGVWRDTWWGSCLSGEWEGEVKKALESWLGEDNFDGDGGMKRKLESFREVVN